MSNELKREKRALILSYASDMANGREWRLNACQQVSEYRELGDEWSEKVGGFKSLEDATNGLVKSESDMKRLAMKCLLEYAEGGSSLAGIEGRKKGSFSRNTKAAIACLKDFVKDEESLRFSDLENLLDMDGAQINRIVKEVDIADKVYVKTSHIFSLGILNANYFHQLEANRLLSPAGDTVFEFRWGDLKFSF
ncbi:hypothetical protein [Shewanella violacea]|uniref:Uncharacterized protein n=1 Tax=Shewanella violacea (strain JCM 10179 / CIP 106290 / LMG 19151 / DSS12) TaxID=637905 RepID=D4ZD07_SHEVD|nr:hypothetical protein [Shewanella violacea]BAJ03902.1 hypothetical protein SVI_3931 [Shewanella violacea DSS12]